MLVAMLTVVVMVSAAHGCDGHSERLHVFSLKLKHVFACLKVVNRNHGVGGATSGVFDGFLGHYLSFIAVVVALMTVFIMTVFVVTVFVVTVFIMPVFVVAVFVVAVFVMTVFVVIVFWEGQIVAGVIAVEFSSVFSVLGKHVDVGGGGFGH